ncbi:Cna B-type domain-containing protein, partial [Erysipelothrix piscisicarius]|uniref:Cna B-type domain-containing protein n=1 Tax=Erysipelothrix piscisicarius TaxID=2485784 RepID=UPI002F949537
MAEKKARDRVVFELYRRVEDNDFEAVSNQKETLLPSMASVTFTDLPVNDQQGRLYEYRVKEIEGPEHFEASYSDDGLTVTNTYNPGVTEVSFTKVWVDGPDTHPTIVVDLYANNVKTEH